MNRPPRWIQLLAVATWAIGLIAVSAGPASFRWRPAADDRWVWPAVVPSTADDQPSTMDDRPLDAGPPLAAAPRGGADVVVLDPFLVLERLVSDLHAQGRAAVCRLRAGVWEADRPDEARVDESLLGTAATAGSRWLDVRRRAELVEVVGDRLALCARKGFDGVVLDDLDGYSYPTGFPLTESDQLGYNTAVVALARAHGLRVAIVVSPWTPVPSNVDVTVTPPRSSPGRSVSAP